MAPIIYTLAFIGGFSIMSLELLGGRVLAPYFGSSIYVWGSIITVFMLSLSIGYLLGGRLSLHNPTLGRFALIFLAAAVCLYPLVYFSEDIMVYIFERVLDPRYGSLLASAILFIVPTVIMGMISPYSVRMLVQTTHQSGHVAGVLYFVSTLGSALGTLATSFYLILWFEINTILTLLTGALLAMAVLAAVASRFGGSLPRSGSAALALLGALLVLPGPAPEARIIHQERSLYSNILIDRQGPVVCLQFSVRRDQRNQTCRNERKPREMVFAYAQMMMTSLLLEPRPARVLVLGLGGGTLPMALDEILPEARIDAVEIDPAVVRVAREFFGFAPSNRVNVFAQDGRVFVKRAAQKGETYDLIMLDAFNGEYIPEHLMTREFLEEVKALLAPGGVLAANTFSISDLYHHESATYAAVFDSFYNLRTDASGNRVILTRNGPLPDAATLEERAAALKQTVAPYGVNYDQLMALMTTDRDWNPEARILTDQYSPANLLQSN
ncbi:MAG: fused MFS/spermidine synthase [Pseudomonadales bacterium]